MAEERDGSNAVIKQLFPQGEVQIVSGAATRYYYTRDHLGSVREMLDSLGNIVARYSYDPYGRTMLVQGTNLAAFQYAGDYLHQTSGLNLTLYRAYDSSTARWLSRDPFPDAERRQGPNLYEYVGDGPVGRLDPLGLNWFGSGDYYGNWGGSDWSNGKSQSEESNFLDHQKFVKPIDDRDQCYQQHDYCLHNCSRISNPACRKKCRCNCDNHLAACLHGVSSWSPWKIFEQTEVFPGPNAHNCNAGEYHPEAAYYPPPGSVPLAR